MLLILMAIFTVLSDVFLTYDNLVGNVMMNSTILLLVALAGTFPILQQSIDLSVASIVSLSGVITALLINNYSLGLLALVIGVLAGVGVGLLNGVVFAKGKIPSFLVTLGSLSVFSGSALLMTGGRAVPYNAPGIREIAIGNAIPNVPNLVLWGLLFYVLASLLAWKTTFGRYTYALGENERVADFSGVNVDRYKIGAFVVSGTLCGLAGVLLTVRISSATSGMADGLLLESIAAIVMGGTALTGGVGGPHRTILGVLVIGVLTNGMNLLSIQSFVQEIVLGFVVIFAVALSIDRDKIDVIK
ncbi:ABC transporter permease [Halopenitus sp. H-Gu1]|uniref:ABC transporter permease n=1 Tax=Halopenitus sp. H-Gu1 TaxID=3242697 RepID=UPI00359D3B7E